jgi:hypothetical protein
LRRQLLWLGVAGTCVECAVYYYFYYWCITAGGPGSTRARLKAASIAVCKAGAVLMTICACVPAAPPGARLVFCFG